MRTLIIEITKAEQIALLNMLIARMRKMKEMSDGFADFLDAGNNESDRCHRLYVKINNPKEATHEKVSP